MIDNAPDADEERYGLTWIGQRAAMRAATTQPHARLAAADGSPCDFDAATHLLIEGDNLDALKLLLPTHHGRFRVIYIDPPYNTGQRFAFVDRFAGRRVTGQAADQAARAHSAWLSLMWPRLVAARELLRDDGAIFVSIGCEELHTLLAAMHAIFGEACFKNIIVVRRGAKNVQAQFETIDALSRGHEYVIFFARSPATRFRKLALPADDVPRGTWNNHWRGTERPTMRYALFGITPPRGQWRWGQERSEAAAASYTLLCQELGTNRPDQDAIDAWVARRQMQTGARVDLLRLSRTGKPEHYVPPAQGKLASDLWTDLKPNGSAQLRQIFGAVPLFETPKSCDLIRRLVTFASDPGDLVLDFFAGTCATAQAVMEANAASQGPPRRCVCVQEAVPLRQPVALADGTTLTTIAAIGFERMRRAAALRGDATPFERLAQVWRVLPADG
jgi:adenine-specific DNA-methyltransferase